MAYVAPNWKNGAAPALDAAALQAISDAIVANQTKNTQQDSSISSLQSALNAKGNLVMGSYTGTGLYGYDNRNEIILPPSGLFLIWIYGYYTNASNINITSGVLSRFFATEHKNIIYTGHLSAGYRQYRGINLTNSSEDGDFASVNTASGEKLLRWSSSKSATAQANAKDTRYMYFAVTV